MDTIERKEVVIVNKSQNKQVSNVQIQMPGQKGENLQCQLMWMKGEVKKVKFKEAKIAPELYLEKYISINRSNFQGKAQVSISKVNFFNSSLVTRQ